MFLVLPLFLSFQFFLACRIKASTYEVAISKRLREMLSISYYPLVPEGKK